MTHANICGSDLHFWRGDAPLRLPDDGWIFGHEMTGRVARLGARVKTDSLGRPLKEGDRVAYTYFYPCGRCYACLTQGARGLPEQDRAAARARARSRTSTAPSPTTTTSARAARSSRCPTCCSDEAVAAVNCALSQVMYGLHVAGVR